MNANYYNVAQQDQEYIHCLDSADLVLNDGIGLDLGAKIFGFRFEENMNGTDFTPELLKMANEYQLKVYLLGASPGVAERAAEKIKQKIPGLQIVGAHDGYFKDSDEMIRKINELNTDVLLIGMGAPLQEKWVSKYANQLDAKIIIAAGAYLDFAAEHVKRAPKWMRAIRMEWGFRLIGEPRRLWKRYLIGNVLFFIHIFKNRMSSQYRKKEGTL